MLDEPEIRDGEVFATSSKLINGTMENSIPGWYKIKNMSLYQCKEAGIEDEDYNPSDIPYFDEADVIALMSEEERELYEAEKKGQKKQVVRQKIGRAGRIQNRNMSLSTKTVSLNLEPKMLKK